MFESFSENIFFLFFVSSLAKNQWLLKKFYFVTIFFISVMSLYPNYHKYISCPMFLCSFITQFCYSFGPPFLASLVEIHVYTWFASFQSLILFFGIVILTCFGVQNVLVFDLDTLVFSSISPPATFILCEISWLYMTYNTISLLHTSDKHFWYTGFSFGILFFSQTFGVLIVEFLQVLGLQYTFIVEKKQVVFSIGVHRAMFSARHLVYTGLSFYKFYVHSTPL